MATAIDLSTTYLGLRLTNPFMIGASPLANDLDTVRRLEDAGSAAIVLPSLFEEQITMARTGRIRHLDPLDPQFAAVRAYVPGPEGFDLSPDQYLEHLARVKRTVGVPVIASLNGTTAESWLTFARAIEQAGADALELNMYEVATNPDDSSAAIERRLCASVIDLRDEVNLPIAVKLSPFFTAMGHVAHALDRAGAAGLVLFNRFYQPDINLGDLTVVPTLELSTSSELLLRLRWTAILHARIRASIAATGGVATAADGIKALLAGANAVQMVSAILRHGPPYFSVMRDGLAQWMEARGFASLHEINGLLSLAKMPDPDAFERANYLRMLHSWREKTPS